MFLYNIINFNFSKIFSCHPIEGKVKFPLLDELHPYIFSFLDQRGQQNALLVNKYWCQINVKLLTNNEIQKIQNFIYLLVCNIDKKQFEIKKEFEHIYQQNRDELESLSLDLNKKLNCLSLTSFKISLLPIKELMIFNLKEMMFSVNQESLEEKFQSLKINEPTLLDPYFDLCWKDFQYELAEEDSIKYSQFSLEFFTMREFDRAIRAAIKIEDEHNKVPICFFILIGLLEEGLIEKAHYLEQYLPADSSELNFALPFYRYYLKVKNGEMEKKYQRKLDK